MREDYLRRLDQFPEKIHRIAENNPLVRMCIQEYATGGICFMDEALAQMVIGLAVDWGRQREEYIRFAQMTVQPPVTLTGVNPLKGVAP